MQCTKLEVRKPLNSNKPVPPACYILLPLNIVLHFYFPSHFSFLRPHDACKIVERRNKKESLAKQGLKGILPHSYTSYFAIDVWILKGERKAFPTTKAPFLNHSYYSFWDGLRNLHFISAWKNTVYFLHMYVYFFDSDFKLNQYAKYQLNKFSFLTQKWLLFYWRNIYMIYASSCKTFLLIFDGTAQT